MELPAAEKLAKELMAKHLSELWSFAWHNKKRAYGTCRYSIRTILLSKPLTLLRTEENVRDTILHEIAHAIAPEHGHGRGWKLAAIAIGARPERCGSADDEGIVLPQGKWLGTCPTGHTVSRFRKPRGNYSCSRCARRFDERFLFTWTVKSDSYSEGQ